jgi:hypothetical protein
MSKKEKALNDSNSPFKEKEKKGGEGRSQLSAQWKVFQCLVANGRF